MGSLFLIVFILPVLKDTMWWDRIDGIVQECDISTTDALEILQPCTKPLVLGSGCFIQVLLSLNVQICDMAGSLELKLENKKYFSQDDEVTKHV